MKNSINLPVLTAGVGFFIFTILATALGGFVGFIGAAAWLTFLLYPLTKVRELAGIDILEDTMRNEGFNAIQAKNAPIGKY